MLPSPMRALGRKFQENTPDDLHIAVITGRTKKIKQLIRKGVHIESVNFLGQTPLFSASFGGDLEVVEVLLRLGANPNRRCGNKGASPTHAAAYRGSRRVLRALVEAGGCLSIRDCEDLTPRDYASKQPSPLRREKILKFLDLLSAMMLHRLTSANLPPPVSSGGTVGNLMPESGTLRSQKRSSLLGGSHLSLSRRTPSYQSSSSLWSSCVSDMSLSSPSPSTDGGGVGLGFEAHSRSAESSASVVMTTNLHQNVSCHLLDQLCVTTSLPLLTPSQLKRPATPSPAYTCGGPTVYSSFTWMGTPVTVRRPTPALSMSRKGIFSSNDDADQAAPDQDAVRSLLQELAFLRRIRHPGFLEVMAACHVTHPSPDHVTLIYQHVPHGSLFHHLHVQHRDLTIGSAVDILIGLVEAVLFMHAHGFLHCGLSSHALHLVSLSNAKLGGFEYALESQAKGVGMRAEHLSRAGWLIPWQAPETILDKMVSVRSEVYGVSSVMWEIWSGIAPWSGVEDDEIRKRIRQEETLPPLKDSCSSLISYLTEYGLKWSSHERELDLQEMHTMLRSMKIQCNENERVPAVSSWGPPSIPNTPPASCRESDLPTSSHCDSSLTSSSSTSSGELSIVDGDTSGRECMAFCTSSPLHPPPVQSSLRSGSSCSRGFGTRSGRPPVPISPAIHDTGSSRYTRSANSSDSLPKFDCKPPSSRPLSVFTGKTAEISSTLPAKTSARRSLEVSRHRSRKQRRKPEIEFEEEFIDDEFDAALFEQPHMQLSVGSSENLLDKRLSFSLGEGDSESCTSGDTPCRLTSSDEEIESNRNRTRQLSSQNDNINNNNYNDLNTNCRNKNNNIDDSNPASSVSNIAARSTCSDKPIDSATLNKSFDDLLSQKTPLETTDQSQESPQTEAKHKFKALTLERSFKYYMPKYSIDNSDSEEQTENS